MKNFKDSKGPRKEYFGKSSKPSGSKFGGRGSRSFDRDSAGSGGRSFGKERMEMHKAVCDQCGESCSVPFKPTSGKAIFCSNCFRKEDRGDSFKPRSAQPSSSTRDLDQINKKLDKILEILEGD